MAPGPLPRGNASIRETNPAAEILESSLVEACAQLPNAPVEAWNRIVGISSLGPFSEHRLMAIETLVTDLPLIEHCRVREEFLESLAAAAEVAAKQACARLSGAVAATLISNASKFIDITETEIGFITLVACSGAIETSVDRNEWLGLRLAEYAYVLPRGAPCGYLHARITSIERLLPLEQRIFSVAKKLASSASI